LEQSSAFWHRDTPFSNYYATKALIINRTVVCGALTVVLAMVYFGGVTTPQAIFRTLTGQEEQPQLAIVVSTVVIAALFNALEKSHPHVNEALMQEEI
jgi:hypothetical protein